MSESREEEHFFNESLLNLYILPIVPENFTGEKSTLKKKHSCTRYVKDQGRDQGSCPGVVQFARICY